MTTNERLHIGVMGAGAIGGYVGARLAAKGATEVTLIGRKALADTIARHGVTLRELDHDAHVDPAMVRIEEDVHALSSCDVVFCCVKSGATAETAKILANVLEPTTVVVSLQNGLRNPEVLSAALPRNPVLPAVVDFNVIICEGAVFHRTTSGSLIIETRAEGQDQPWVDALRAAGLEVEEMRPIAPEQWTKLLLNLNNAVSALSGAPTRDMILSRPYRRVISTLINEGLDVLHEAGIRTANFHGVPLRVMAFILKLPTPIVRMVIRAQLRIDPEARTSMWTDLERGRPTEVDFLNGEIVRLADQHGIAAPINRRIAELVHEAERAGAGSPQMGAETLLRSFKHGS
ncbi:MAG: 2-dehydropantoate 2-reductase [Deltaproteobacteria bacterium]